MLPCKVSCIDSERYPHFSISFSYLPASLNGERPVVVYHGGPSDLVAVQFVERKEVLVGKNLSKNIKLTKDNFSQNQEKFSIIHYVNFSDLLRIKILQHLSS